jgi:sigma-E factor negative regulatory protein RseA
MRARISALMDSELDAGEIGEPLKALGEDAEAREAWRTYHLISDALQGGGLLGSDCLRRVSGRLAQEPALIGPLPAQVAAARRPRWFLPSALAASVAAVALVGWMAFAPQASRPPLQPEVAAAPPPTPPLARAKAPARQPLTEATRDYLIAHQAFSPRTSLQGMAPYVRSVSAERGPGSKP